MNDTFTGIRYVWLCLLMGVCLSGCGYPQVSPKAYELSKALYSACNRRSEEQLTRVVELIESHSSAGDINRRESEWLTAIVDQARARQWHQAMIEARQIMEDQAAH